MAKKKNKTQNKTASEKVVKKESMVSKIEVKKPMDQEKISKLVGTIFIVLGLALISYGIYSYVKFSRSPELNEELESPSLSGTEVLTNEEFLDITGIADGYDEVFLYVDNEEVDRVKVNDDATFEYQYGIEEEGKYAVSVAGVKGFPKRYMSPQSDMRIVEVDWTAPELVDIKYSPEVGTDFFVLLGEVEPGAEVVVRRGTNKYVAQADETGAFEIKEILLDVGPNVFTMSISDDAGNEVEVEEKIRVEYSLDSDINGNAVYDSIPVASGNLESAFAVLRENSLMMVFGLLAMISFVSSSVFVYIKNRKEI